MPIDNEINRLQTNLQNAYNAVATKAGTVPTNQNFDNLPAAINSITSGSEVEAQVSADLDTINGEVV